MDMGVKRDRKTREPLKDDKNKLVYDYNWIPAELLTIVPGQKAVVRMHARASRHHPRRRGRPVRDMRVPRDALRMWGRTGGGAHRTGRG